jgi:uncharacterized phage protein (TIGR01671 family)
MNNREIKFRAWDGKKMFNSDSQIGGLWSFNVFNGNPELKDGWELMQFTGLRDKNREPIYEGDILDVNAIVETSENYFEEPIESNQCIICEVFYNLCVGGFDLRTIEKDLHLSQYCLMDDCQKEYEVIGNIYENPELLK